MRFALVSFRLGAADGVSVETEKWRAALAALGHDTYRVAGAFGAAEAGDVHVPGLGYAAGGGATGTAAPSRGELESALGAADVVVVENMFGLPLNVAASAVLAEVLEDRTVIGHHHDLVSQRPESTASHDLVVSLFPPALPRMAHVTINDLSRRELEARGIPARVVPNTFDPEPAPGLLVGELRAKLGVTGRDATLALVPSRVIPRKRLSRTVAFCEALAAAGPGPVVLLVTGPVEDGHAAEFGRLCERTGVDVAHEPGWFGPSGTFSVADAYGAADVVVFASDWEGFGNPVMESVAYARPLVVSAYPVLVELESLGFAFTHLHDDPAAAVDAYLSGRCGAQVGPNREVLAAELSPARLVAALEELVDTLA